MTNPRNKLLNNYVYGADLNFLRIEWSLNLGNVWIIGLGFYPDCIINVLVKKFVVALLGLHLCFPLQMLPDQCQGHI